MLLHVYITCNLTITLVGKGDGDELTGKKSAKPLTTVQDCVSTFIIEKPCSVFIFQLCFCGSKNTFLVEKSEQLKSCL